MVLVHVKQHVTILVPLSITCITDLYEDMLTRYYNLLSK